MNGIEKGFINVVDLIQNARENALRKVNEELILLYWNVGKYISEQVETQKWGNSYVDEMASFISENCPGIKGFNRRGLYRMKQFYETYKDNEFVSPLVTQISWTNHLLILSSTSVGVILCANKEDEVVEFALSRSLSPTLISEYTLKLIDKKLLRQKLHELSEIAGIQQLNDNGN